MMRGWEVGGFFLMRKHHKAADNESDSGALHDFLEAVFRHKLLIVTFFVAVVGVTFFVVMTTPNTYTSMAKILIQRGRENARPDPTASLGEMAPVNRDWENEINSEVEILNNLELITAAVQSVGLERMLDPRATSESGRTHKIIAWLQKPEAAVKAKIKSWLGGRSEESSPKKQHEQLASALEVMQRSLSITSQKRSDVIVIYFTSTDPVHAQEVITTLLRLYKDKRKQIHSTVEARKFFTEQTTALLNKLNETETEIRRLLNELGVVSLDSGRNLLETRLATLQGHKLTSEAERAASQARIARLNEMIHQADAGSSSKSGIVRGDYKDIQNTLRLEETSVAALTAQIQTLDQQMLETQQSLDRLNLQESSIRELQRRRDLLTAQYNKYASSLEQTRMDQALEDEMISNVRIVQAPTVPAQPNRAQKKIKLMLAAFMGLFGGLASALVLEKTGSKIRRPEESELRLQLMPLATIPEISVTHLHPLLPLPQPHPEEKALVRQARNGHIASPDIRVIFSRLVRRIMAFRSLQSSSPLILGVTSCYGGEGVTSVASHLATSFSLMNTTNKVLYLDANRHPHSEAHAEWLEEARGGLEVRITAEGTVAFHPRRLEGKAEDGGKPGAALERISHDRITPLLRRAAAQGFDIMVVDIPPLSEGSEAEHISSLMNAVILVIEAERTRWQTVQWAKNLLADTGTHLLGIVLNKQHKYIPSWLERRL
jgi:succinoglycan biosynthesis transport protein ExoP